MHSKYKLYHTPLNETLHGNILRTPLWWKTPKSRNYRVFKPFFPLRSSRKPVTPKHGHKKPLVSHHKPPESRSKGWWCYPIKMIVCGWYAISASSTPPLAKILPIIVVFQASATSNLVATIKLYISFDSHTLCSLITWFPYEWKPSEVTSVFVTWQRWKTQTTSFAYCPCFIPLSQHLRLHGTLHLKCSDYAYSSKLFFLKLDIVNFPLRVQSVAIGSVGSRDRTQENEALQKHLDN